MIKFALGSELAEEFHAWVECFGRGTGSRRNQNKSSRTRRKDQSSCNLTSVPYTDRLQSMLYATLVLLNKQ